LIFRIEKSTLEFKKQIEINVSNLEIFNLIFIIYYSLFAISFFLLPTGFPLTFFCLPTPNSSAPASSFSQSQPVVGKLHKIKLYAP